MKLREFFKKAILRCSVFLLPLSTGFSVVMITLLMLDNLRFPSFVISGITLASGGMFLYTGFLIKNRVRFYFASIFLILVGILFFVLDLNIINIPLRMIWPLLLFCLAMSFYISGFFRYRKMHAVYTVLAVAFSLLGFIFLLFSTKVIKIPFKTIAFWWFPLFFLPYIIVFIVWLFRRTRTAGEIDV